VALLPGAAGNFVLDLALFGARHEIVVPVSGNEGAGKVRPAAANVARDGVLTAMVWAKIWLRSAPPKPRPWREVLALSLIGVGRA